MNNKAMTTIKVLQSKRCQCGVIASSGGRLTRGFEFTVTNGREINMQNNPETHERARTF